jgi:hypothetical protein
MAIISNKKLALIHVVKKELNLSDQEYRSILRRVTGVDTAKDITDEGFRKLMQFFVRSEHFKVNPYGLTIRQKLYIKQLALDLRWTDSHLLNFLKKYYHKDDINELSKKDAVRLIESLKNIKKHSN